MNPATITDEHGKLWTVVRHIHNKDEYVIARKDNGHIESRIISRLQMTALRNGTGAPL